MIMFLYGTIILVLKINICSSELKLLQSTFRHGDRYPLTSSTRELFPLNPHANVTWFPDSDGGLTITGKRRSYNLGVALRARYGSWFEKKQPTNIVEFHSADSERAIMTASLVAAGLFPPYNGSQKWNPSLNWQPIPISLSRYPQNILFYGCFICGKYNDLLEKTKLIDPTIIEYDARMKSFYDFVSSKIGGPVNNRILYYLYMELLSTVSAGLSPPEWTKVIFLNGSLERAAIMEYKYSSWTDELKRLTGGIWLKRWLKHVDEYINARVTRLSSAGRKNMAQKRAFFYSGHDINVAGIMNTLGIFYPHVPNYSSAINLELHENDKQQFYVKVAYRDSGEFMDYTIPSCGVLHCPLNTFRNIFLNVLTISEIEDCGPFGKY